MDNGQRLGAISVMSDPWAALIRPSIRGAADQAIKNNGVGIMCCAAICLGPGRVACFIIVPTALEPIDHPLDWRYDPLDGRKTLKVDLKGKARVKMRYTAYVWTM